MFALLGNLFQSRAQRKQYQNSAAIARINARGYRAAGESSAAATEKNATFNQTIANSNLRTARENAARTLSGIRAAQGASGLMQEGSGNQRYLNAQEALNKQIADMELSASVAMGNALQQASSERRTGEAQAIQAEYQAASYSAAAASVKKSMLTQGIMGIGSAAVGAAVSYSTMGAVNGKDMFAAASNLMDYGANIGTLSSPYTAAIAGDPNTRKNNWRGIFAIANGNTPYHTTGQFTTYNTAW